MKKPKLYKTASVREVQRNFADYLEIAQIMPVYVTHRGVEKGVIKTTSPNINKIKSRKYLYGSLTPKKNKDFSVEQAVEKAKELKLERLKKEYTR